MELRIARARNGTHPVPRYAKDGDAGMDFCADMPTPVIVWPKRVAVIPLGWRVEIPNGYAGLLRPRSGHLAQGLVMANVEMAAIGCNGVIDSGYRGEIKYCVINTTWCPKIIRPGERICQMVIVPVVRARVGVVSQLSETERGNGGFGHTGKVP